MNSEIRLCVDLKVTLNKYVSVDQYPLPKKENLFQNIHECNAFCRINLANAYLQLEVHERNIRYCGAYQDDILIGGTDYNSCKSVLYAVLSRHNDYNIKINIQKSELFVKLLEMLCYVLSTDGLSPCESKIEKLINTKSPQNVTQLKSYLGMLDYYHTFIKMTPDVIEQLHNLLRNCVSWEWTDECEKAFFMSNSVISEKSLLVSFDPRNPIILTCESSNYGIGAVLSQLHNGIEKPVAFQSAMLNNAQIYYSQLHREALNIIYGVTKFHNYLVRNKFTIVTDHELL
ncbi:hypothetical protein PR048_031810 [Dryococelus australis]|uniref:Reverse transcriptase/retrotransposon-derived protein RNase H-like domain-containing protein n=1 Tax=Dryococelus australis TaxID=614101 RepID=A0ABQ9G8Z4_9NEOP|nr:hypothetical protein PR048_031810 [Dryococelus australis]